MAILKTFIHYSIVMVSLCTLSALSSADTFYKWKDNGTWKYGSHPPAGVEAIVIKTTVGKASSAQTQDETTESEETEKTELEGELFAETKPKISAEEKQNRCQAGSNNLETLSSKAVIRLRDADGEVRNLTVDEREAEKEKAKLIIERYCP